MILTNTYDPLYFLKINRIIEKHRDRELVEHHAFDLPGS